MFLKTVPKGFKETHIIVSKGIYFFFCSFFFFVFIFLVLVTNHGEGKSLKTEQFMHYPKRNLRTSKESFF